MNPDQRSLQRIEAEIIYLKRRSAEMEANGLIDRLPTYGTLTNRQRLEKDLARCEKFKKDYEAKMRYDRIMSRWHLRKLDRRGTPPSRTDRPDQILHPMKIDDIIQDRRIVDIG